MDILEGFVSSELFRGAVSKSWHNLTSESVLRIPGTQKQGAEAKLGRRESLVPP